MLRYCLLKVTGEAGSGGGIVASAGQDADRLSVAVLARRSLLSARSGFAAVVRAGAGAAVTGLAGGTAAEVTVPGAAQDVRPVRLAAAVATLELAGEAPARALWRLSAAVAGLKVASWSDGGGAHCGIGGMCCHWFSGIGAFWKSALVTGCWPRMSRVQIVTLASLRGWHASFRPTDA